MPVGNNFDQPVSRDRQILRICTSVRYVRNLVTRVKEFSNFDDGRNGQVSGSVPNFCIDLLTVFAVGHFKKERAERGAIASAIRSYTSSSIG